MFYHYTQLALLCSTCGAQTIFSTSSFSTEDPPNYSVNKTLLPLLGPNAYFSLISEVQRSENSMLININMKAAKNKIQQRAKLIMSLDKKVYPGLQQTIGGDIELEDTAIAAPEEQEYHYLQQEAAQGNIIQEEDDDPKLWRSSGRISMIHTPALANPFPYFISENLLMTNSVYLVVLFLEADRKIFKIGFWF